MARWYAVSDLAKKHHKTWRGMWIILNSLGIVPLKFPKGSSRHSFFVTEADYHKVLLSFIYRRRKVLVENKAIIKKEQIKKLQDIYDKHIRKEDRRTIL